MRHPTIIRTALVTCIYMCCVLSVAEVVSAQARQSKLIWEIGRPDGNTEEFALAPDNYNDFSEDAFYVIGRSDTGIDWPYVHPGPSDIWAGGRKHTFSILFGLKKKLTSGHLTLLLDLVDSHRSAPPSLHIDFNGYAFKVTVPKGGTDASIDGNPAEGKNFHFTASIPYEACKAGVNTLTITNASGSWILYDRLGLESPLDAELDPVPVTVIESVKMPQVLQQENSALHQLISIDVFNTVRDRNVEIHMNGDMVSEELLARGNSAVTITHPAVQNDTPVTIEVKADGVTIASYEDTLEPVRKWTVYFLPHSHVDIGYTHLQSEVALVQGEHIENAIGLAEKTADYPEGARFKWNVEVLWPVHEYLKISTAEKKDAFIAAVKKGQIGLDGLYGSILTGLGRPEELFQYTGFARKLSKRYGLNIDSAMITDVPGYTWGLVPALSRSGIRFFNPGPNHMPMLPHQGDRIGYTSEEWGDCPFYWVSPSGKEKVLVWIPTHGYSWFHGWILGNIKKSGAKPILGYLEELIDKKYPYEMVQLRYTIGADNGPPDPDLPEFVKKWNAEYAWPRMVIATTSEMFREFEARYGEDLPHYSGDFTPYWEDGAASTARELSINRNAAERLVQAQTLWSLNDPGTYPAGEFDEVWRNIVLFDEHTWGAHSSISAPESDFVISQWNIKKAFAENADEESRKLLATAAGITHKPGTALTAVDIHNTSSWARSDLVILPADTVTAGGVIKDGTGETVPSQRLSTGELAFLAEDVPPLGARRYTIHDGSNSFDGSAAAHGTMLSNENLRVVIDEKNGTIRSLKTVHDDTEYAGTTGDQALNGYFYIPGKNPDDALGNGPVTVTVKENGPLVASLLIVSDAPGCNRLQREVRIVDGLNRIDIVNTVDKRNVYDKESVHFGFPFHVPDGQIRLDVAWGVVRPDIDQLTGANKNYFTVQRWVDVSNDRYGVTLATIDAPLVEIGGMNAEVWNLDPSRPWLKEVEPSQTVYSYVMNNYWHTNYKASQEGEVAFRYSLLPHGEFDSADAKRFGIECSQPLIAVPVPADAPVEEPPFRFESNSILLTSLKPSEDGKALIARLFNAGDTTDRVEVKLNKGTAGRIWLSNIREENLSQAGKALKLDAYEIADLRIETVEK